MIVAEDHPVSWAMLLYQLGDAHEHLGSLVGQLTDAGQIDEEEFRVWNRAIRPVANQQLRHRSLFAGPKWEIVYVSIAGIRIAKSLLRIKRRSRPMTSHEPSSSLT